MIDCAERDTFPEMNGDIYQWMGFEARDLIFDFLDEAVKDHGVTLDVFAYDLNEPDFVARLEALGPRLRAIIDDSTEKSKTGIGTPKREIDLIEARLRRVKEMVQ